MFFLSFTTGNKSLTRVRGDLDLDLDAPSTSGAAKQYRYEWRDSVAGEVFLVTVMGLT